MKTGKQKVLGIAVPLTLAALLVMAGISFSPAFTAGESPAPTGESFYSHGSSVSAKEAASPKVSEEPSPEPFTADNGTSPVPPSSLAGGKAVASAPPVSPALFLSSSVGAVSSAASSPSSQWMGSSSTSPSGTSSAGTGLPVTQVRKVTSAAPVSSASSGSVAAAVPPPFVHPAKMVVGYYGGWGAYSGFTPDKISASSLHVINYAFAKIGADLKIAAGDPYIDYSNFQKLNALKKSYPSLKTVISVGGWDDSGKFSDMALTESSRSAFADSAVQFLRTYGFDGVDIDWEYPTGGGLAGNGSRSADKTNFGLLLKTLRAKLDAQGIKDGRHYILSFAGAANSGYAAGVNFSGIAQYVDYATIMTYDLHGGWDSYTDFNAPLYLPAGQSPQYKTSVDSVVRTWLSYGFPAGKLVLGVPFYGYAYQGAVNANNGLWQRFSSAATVGYDTVQSKYLSSTSYQRFYDSAALVPWLFNGSTFVSYDDAASIQRKAQYAVSKNLLGVGAWELAFDKTGTLIRTVKNTLS